jgi:hypothetical protein
MPNYDKPNRRQFLAWSAASAGLLAAHECLALHTMRPPAMTVPRIVSLDLVTAAPLPKLKEFYHALLGLHLLEDTPDRLSIAAGETRLTFTKAERGKPFYHFAFNIPENKILSAHDWQKERTPLLPIPADLRDPALPDGVVNYAHWNAHSVFFFDPAGNVVEHIARHDLKNGSKGAFGSKDILYASEIAFVTDDVAATATALKGAAGIEQYRGASDQFAALGDEHGLLLVMKRGRVISFDSPEKKAVTVFPTKVEVRGARAGYFTYPEFPYRLSVIK